MKTEISTEFGKDPEYDKVISINHGSFTIEDWVATLSVEEQHEWRLQHSIHENAVHLAVAAGDAQIVRLGAGRSSIKWKSEPIHSQWMNTISAEDNVIYHSFWARYHAAMAERNT
jgi:hypothetical protein